MDGFIELVVAIVAMAILLVAAAVIGAWAFATAWRAAAAGDSIPQFSHALARTGIAPEQFQGEEDIMQLARASRRCHFCRCKAECLATLAADPGSGFLNFCPNAGFFARASARQAQA